MKIVFQIRSSLFKCVLLAAAVLARDVAVAGDDATCGESAICAIDPYLTEDSLQHCTLSE